MNFEFNLVFKITSAQQDKMTDYNEDFSYQVKLFNTLWLLGHRIIKYIHVA